MDITWDRVMDDTIPEVTYSLWKAWLNGSPVTLDFTDWVSNTLLRVGFVHTTEDGDIFTVQLPEPDPNVTDSDGCKCLGFGPISDTFVVGMSKII